MSPQQDDIRVLERAILQEASGEAQRTLTDARARVSSLRQETQAQLESERAAIVARANDEAASLLDQTVAEVRVDAQSLRLRRREKLLDQVFSDAQARLADAATWSDYGDLALFLVRDAAEHIESDAMIVMADAATARYLGEEVLSSLGQDIGIRLVMGDRLTEGTGVILVTHDGHRRFDNTLERRLDRMHDRLRAPIFHILMGEDS
jgi:vacuolar-type H+-ATPase subunit E/Vma4